MLIDSNYIIIYIWNSDINAKKMDHHSIINSDFYTKQENSVNEKPRFPGALVSHDYTTQQ